MFISSENWSSQLSIREKCTQLIVIANNKSNLSMSSDWSPVDLNAEVRLVKVPGKEYPKTNDIFQYVVVPPVPTDNVPKGHVLVKNLFLSIDATMRIWISGVKSYMEPVKPGDMMKGMGVGEVIFSNGNMKVGTIVMGMLDWQKYALI